MSGFQRPRPFVTGQPSGEQAGTRRARPSVPDEVMALVEERQAARVRRDWAVADVLRERIAETGWSVLDTPEGPRLEPR